MNIKSFVVTGLGVLVATGVVAADNDTLLTFSTPGPDSYADGTPVKDGECYALCWTKTGSVFAGILANGAAADPENNAVLVVVPRAKDGRCQTTGFQIDADLAARYRDGGYSIYLLDTRLADGRVGGVDASGNVVAVNGYGEVKKEEPGVGNEGVSSILASGAAKVSEVADAPADAPKPVVKAVEVKGAYVYLTVANTVPYLQYAAKEVKVGGEGGESGSSNPATQGAVGEDVLIVAPRKGSSGFFKVGRK